MHTHIHTYVLKNIHMYIKTNIHTLVHTKVYRKPLVSQPVTCCSETFDVYTLDGKNNREICGKRANARTAYSTKYWDFLKFWLVNITVIQHGLRQPLLVL
jgi:hypothetical protein